MKVERMYFRCRFDAVRLLNIVQDFIDEKGYMRLVDYYDIYGSYDLFNNTDLRFGWRDIKGAKIVADRHCGHTDYFLEMPDAIEL